MAIDLGEFVESLKREISPPGENLFPDATDDDFLGNLQDAFWDAKLDGLLSGYTEAEGAVSAISGTENIPRELVQLVIAYAGIRIVRNQLRSLNTLFRAQAGPVEFEQQKSAQLLKGLLDELRERRILVLARLGDMGLTSSYYIDSLVARDNSFAAGDAYWVV